MPRWLAAWVGISLAVWWSIALLIGVPFLLTKLTQSGEQDFTRDQTAYLKEQFPGGTFTAPSEYKWCDGRMWVFFDSRGDTWNVGASCWKPQ